MTNLAQSSLGPKVCIAATVGLFPKQGSTALQAYAFINTCRMGELVKMTRYKITHKKILVHGCG